METKSKQRLHNRQPAVSELDSPQSGVNLQKCLKTTLKTEVANFQSGTTGRFTALEGARSLFHSLAKKENKRLFPS